MAMLCMVPLDGDTKGNVSPRPRIPNISRTGWDEATSRWENGWKQQPATDIYARAEGRYYTAILDDEGGAYTRPRTTTRSTYTTSLEQASVLVAELSRFTLATSPPSYDCLPPPYQDDDPPPLYDTFEELVRSAGKQDVLVPLESTPAHDKAQSKRDETMNRDIDFDSTAGFQTRGKAAKKAAKKAQQSKWADDDDEGSKKEPEGGEDGSGGGGDSGGGAGGAGGDDNNDGNNNEEDEWGSFGLAKTKKKTKKQQREEEEEKRRQEEEEQKKKEEEEAANAGSNANPLSWADDTNDITGNDDWTTGFTAKKDKKKKKKGVDEDSTAAISDPPATSAFHEISLDDGAPKLDFSFDGAETKKDSGFGKWGATWDFGSIGKSDDKKDKDADVKEASTSFGDNNPWSLGGSKSKSKTKSGFDFGDFGATNEINFDSADVGDTKAADDAWGFAAVNKKDKKKKDDVIPEPETKEDNTWGAWGSVGKKDKKGKKEVVEDEPPPPPAAPDPPPAVDEWSFGFGKKDKKKSKKGVEEVTPAPEPEPEPESESVNNFDWGFGSKKSKSKNLLDEVKEDPPAESTTEAAGETDWLGGSGWGAVTKKNDKKSKKSVIEDLSTSVDLGSAADTTNDPPADDPWSFTTGKKDKKKGKKEEDAAPAEEENDVWSAFGKKGKKSKTPSPEPDLIEEEVGFEPEPEPVEESLPWDHGLTAAQKKKKEKQMRKDNLWPFGEIGKPVEPAPAAEPEAEPEVVTVAVTEPESTAEPVEETKEWDFGLTPVQRKKKEKQMRKDNLWPFGDIGKPAEPKPAEETADKAEPGPTPPETEAELIEEEPQAWDFGLNDKEKKKKEKEMKKKGLWPFGDIGKPEPKLNAKKVEPEPEPEPELEAEFEADPEPEPEPEKEEALPWDFGLTPKEKKKKEKEMTKKGLWPFGDIGKPPDPEPEPEPEFEPTPELEPEPEHEPESVQKEEPLPWDFGLSAKDRKKKEKEMTKKGLWPFGDIGKPADPEPAPVAEPEPEPEPETKEDDTWGTWGVSAKDKKRKDKDTKPKALIEPEPEVIAAEPEPEPETAKSSMWDTWGMTSKEKKKKESKKQVVQPEPEPEPEVVPEPEPAVEEEPAADAGWGSWGLSAKDKKKKEKETKKKGLLSPTEETPIKETKAEKAEEEDIWGNFSASKTKKGKSSKSEDPPPPVPTPPAQGLSPEPAAVDDSLIDNLDDDTWGGLGKTTSKSSKKVAEKEAVEEKKSSGIWGFGTTTKAKTKKEKEKEAKAKQEAEEAAEQEERLKREIEEAEAAEAAKIAEEDAAAAAEAKSSKKSKGTKSAKSSGKLLDEKKKSNEDTLANLLEDEPAAVEEKTDDYFGAWGSGSTKKTVGKKDKEIAKKGSTNDNDALAGFANDIESPDNDNFGFSSKAPKTMPGKTKVGSSIADRIKALEGKKDTKEDSSSAKKTKAVEETLTKNSTTLVEALSPKEEKKAIKSKATTKSKSKDDVFPAPSPVPEPQGKKSKESVPGSFPGAFDDMEEEENLLGNEPLVDDAEPEPVKSKSKSAKVDKKASKPTKKVKSKEIPEDVPESVMDDLLDLDVEAPKLPTPPPDEKKSAKKERARVERNGNTAAWGFWGAAPAKKESSRKKATEEVSPPSSKAEKKSSPGLSRSKSSRTPKEKDIEDRKQAEKSSGSDKEEKKAERPSKPSRGMSFSQFMLGGPPPSAMRSKSVRQSSSAGKSRSSSRQGSIDGGLASPPPEAEAGMTDKAAKMMGVKTSKPDRQRSVKTKSKAYADPYPIDDDDMVMINTAEAQSPPPEKASRPKTTARRSSTKPRSKTISGDEEVVMVDTAAADAFVTSGPDDLHSPPPRRANSARKSTGFFSSLFGGAKANAEPRAVMTDAEDAPLPIRTKSTSRRRSKVPDGEGFTTDAPMETDGDIEARRVERRAKREANRMAEEEDRAERERRRRERREREEADLQARRARAKERARIQQEEEAAEKEARRERRRQKEAERERAAQEELELNAKAERRRAERARLRAELEAANPAGVVTKEEKRQSYLAEEDDRQRRRERRQVKDESSKRKSSALAAEYHESRSGKGRGTAPPANKTSSWIASQNDEPPELPPISETVLDPSGEKPRSAEDFDDGSGSRKRKDKYMGMTEAEIEEHRARRRIRRLEREKSNSGGSNDRVRSRRDYDAYGDGVRTFDGRPALQRGDSKRSSFIGRFF